VMETCNRRIAILIVASNARDAPFFKMAKFW
jgi:hypothetical protein